MPNNEDLMEYQNLVWSIVNKILCKIPDKNYKIELENELFQEGFLGLIEAKQRFCQEKDVKFTTFAYPYIKGFCLKYLNKEIKTNISFKELVQNEDDYYEEDFTRSDIDIIDTLKTYLKKTNRKLTVQEESILKNKIEDDLDYRTIASLKGCSTKKIYNVMYKYKPYIMEIIKENF